MTIEIMTVLTVISILFGIWQGYRNLKKSDEKNTREETSLLTTVIVKLEAISSNVIEIKSEMSNIKKEVNENRERLVKVEESTRQAHKRLDEMKER